MKKTLFASLLALGLASPVAARPDFEALLKGMTLEEKFGQIQQLDGFAEGPYRPEHPEMIRRGLLGSTLNVRGAARTNQLQHIAMDSSRLGIPVLFAFDVIHGYRTIFPVPLGESASWDIDEVERAAEVAAVESRACGVRWVFAPMVDIARDPRWGRIVEGAGEDPFLGSAMARARVTGFQKEHRVVACAKHWVGYGLVEAGRDYNTVEVSERTLRETYFPPFQAAVEAGVGTFMSAFNDIDGVPSTCNRFTLTDVLRGEWKFPGFVVSDYTSIQELLNHGVAGDGATAFAKALTAGVDMEMVSTLGAHQGPALVRSGRLPLTVVDEAVRRILRIKDSLGLFEHPYTDESLESQSLLAPEHRKLARQVAASSLVLLKNHNQTLPLSKKLRNVVVVGPLGDSQEDMIGSWNGDGHKEDAISLVAGIRAQLPEGRVTFVKGCDVSGGAPIDKAALQAVWGDAEVVVVAVGESAAMTGEATSRSSLDLPGRQSELLQAVQASGKPYVVVLMNGRPLVLNWLEENAPAILETWFAGTEGGNAIADVLFGEVNPSGRLPVTFPRSLGQVPIYYSHRNTGRPAVDPNNKYESKYTDVSNQPLYPFGFGLSYTHFTYGNLTAVPSSTQIKVQVDLTNDGPRGGDEVAQLYIRDRVASVARPVRQLRGFRKVHLEPGQRIHLEFSLGPKELGFWNGQQRFVVEPGTFDVWVGGDSQAKLGTSVESTLRMWPKITSRFQSRVLRFGRGIRE